MSYVEHNGILMPLHDTPKPPHPWPLSKKEDDMGWAKFEAFKKKVGGILLPLRIQWEGLSAEDRRSWASKVDDQ